MHTKSSTCLPHFTLFSVLLVHGSCNCAHTSSKPCSFTPDAPFYYDCTVRPTIKHCSSRSTNQYRRLCSLFTTFPAQIATHSTSQALLPVQKFACIALVASFLLTACTATHHPASQIQTALIFAWVGGPGGSHIGPVAIALYALPCCVCTSLLCMHSLALYALPCSVCPSLLCMHFLAVYALPCCVCTSLLCMHFLAVYALPCSVCTSLLSMQLLAVYALTCLPLRCVNCTACNPPSNIVGPGFRWLI